MILYFNIFYMIFYAEYMYPWIVSTVYLNSL